MLNFFTIFSKGGLVLWLFKLSQEDHRAAINSLIQDVFFENKIEQKYTYNRVTMEFKENKDNDLIYIAGYSSILNLDYIKELLRIIDIEFVQHYKAFSSSSYSGFTKIFNHELDKLEGIVTSLPASPIIEEKTIESSEQINGSHSIFNDHITTNLKNNTNLETKNKECTIKKNEKITSKKKPTKIKQARSWEGTYDEKTAASLDFSASPTITKNNKKKIDCFDSNVNLRALKNENNASSSESKFFSFFKGLVGGKIITEENLDPIMQKIKMHLFSKNVAIDIAERICSSVSSTLIGQTISSFGGISSVVQKSLEEILTHILTPKCNINVLNSIITNTSDRPFVIVFCGVNGVGKSTNLAKIAYHLLNNKQRVLIAACDTFRSGAVEQLRTHVSRFNDIFITSPQSCSLFERGYGKDAAGVASEAIRVGKAEHYNVVMIDTAGRMQNNEPLMRSLAKLIKVNNPDLILFVGEALVGNDGVDQLREFDRHLIEYSDSDNPRRIDGIVLTKFDTIDDKVGAALSMTYATGQPIVFVGVGQTYNDLRILDVKSVVNLLLK